jgi:hypothetical protein
MTFVELILQIRRRAAALPDNGRHRDAIERIARNMLDSTPEGEHVA